MRTIALAAKNVLNRLGLKQADDGGNANRFSGFLPQVRVPDGAIRGRALMTYLCEPFLTEVDSAVFRSHANYAQSVSVANELANRGYVVDVTHWRNKRPPDIKSYDVLFGLGPAFASCARARSSRCKAVYFGTGASAQQTNIMVAARTREFNARHGANLPVNLHDPDDGPAVADYLLVTGDRWVAGTYSAISPSPIGFCPNPIVAGVLDTRDMKDFTLASTNFLWMAAYGALRRRLDIVLEAFEAMPHLNLWICGGLNHEKAFYGVMNRWLTELPNVHDVGWVDVGSPTYREITARCGYLVYPSVSDGNPGTVVNAMASGVVPLTTIETGIDVGGCGHAFLGGSVQKLVDCITSVSQLPASHLAQNAARASEFARNNFDHLTFERCVRSAFDSVGLGGD